MKEFGYSAGGCLFVLGLYLVYLILFVAFWAAVIYGVHYVWVHA